MSHGGRDVIAGIFREETIGLQHEADVGSRHDRVIFWPRQVGVTEGIPENEIGVFD